MTETGHEITVEMTQDKCDGNKGTDVKGKSGRKDFHEFISRLLCCLNSITFLRFFRAWNL